MEVTPPGRAVEGPAPIRVHCRLAANDPRRAGLERAVREALSDLPGPWDVSIEPIEGSFWTVAVVGPDASRWSTTCAASGPQIGELLADRLKAACGRRRKPLAPRSKPPKG